MKINIRKYCKSYYILLFSVAAQCPVLAQMDSQYTQYMYNTATINPAYTGSRDVLSVFGLHRNQWVGIEGAPVTNNLSVSAPVTDQVGLGFTFINEEIGPSQENEISVDFSYHIPVSYDYELYFGIKGTANLINIDFNKLNIYNPSNPSFQQNIVNQFSPNIGLGIYLQSDVAYWGLSMPYLLESEHYNSEKNEVALKKDMPLYFIAGYVFSLSPSIKFKPAFLGSYADNQPFKMDLSANFLYDEKLTLGISYRNQGAVSPMAGFQISDHLYAGYSYDFETGQLKGSTSGTHEIFLRYDFFNRRAPINSSRFF